MLAAKLLCWLSSMGDLAHGAAFVVIASLFLLAAHGWATVHSRVPTSGAPKKKAVPMIKNALSYMKRNLPAAHGWAAVMVVVVDC